MKRRAMAVLVGLVALSTSMAPSFAQTPAETAARWGLLGAWRRDCATPNSRDAATYSYVVRGGALFHDRDFGDSRDSHPIQQAAINPDQTLDVTIFFDFVPSTRKNVFARDAAGRIRVITNYDIKTGVYSVRDGRLTASGNEIAWQTRCR